MGVDAHADETDPSILELGAGHPGIPGLIHHDRIAHDDIDVIHDLDVLPWPWADESWDEIWALDVMEHLRVDVAGWLAECWRILVPTGALHLRLPAFDNPLSWRDPTHQRVFHPQTFDYFDPDKELHQQFGRYYFQESQRWWEVLDVWRDHDPAHGDFRYDLRKRP